jgi:hypothetical protein
MVHTKPVVSPLDRSWLWGVPIATAVTAVVVYVFTVQRGLSWLHMGTDGGELITAAVTLGVPHPPGYPTYIVLGKLASLIPIGNVALRLNLFSAVCTAVAAAFVSATAIGWPRRATTRLELFAAWVAGLTFAFAPLVWSQAIITEVYGLNLAVLAALLWALLTGRPVWWVGVLFGLSLTTHLTSALMLPLILLIVPRQQWMVVLGGACLGVLPLLLIPVLAAGDSPVVWGDPTTPSGWLWLVSGALYRPNLYSLPPAELLTRLQQALPALLRQFAFIGWLLLPVAFTRSWRTRTMWYLAATAAGYAAYATVYNSVDHVLYFLPGLLLLTLLLIPGLRSLRQWSPLLPVLLLTLNLTAMRVDNSTAVHDAVAALFEQTPANAVLLTSEDVNIFTLWYYQHVEGLRPDVVVVDRNLMGFDWYRQRLGYQSPKLHGLEQYDVAEFVRSNIDFRPICTATLLEPAQIICNEALIE